jgi:hypothetical protein
VPDEFTCLIPIDQRYETSSLVRGVRAALTSGTHPRLALCFLQHVTRQRICVQGEVEILPSHSPEVLWLRMRVSLAFFHCPRYIRTRVTGLHRDAENMPAVTAAPRLIGPQPERLSEAAREFLTRQVLCYLCTVDQHGQYAVNHRGGAAGYLVTMPPDRLTPGGVVLLPDYAGNGAFEAIGNILETGKAALLVPGYAEEVALCVAGDAVVVEPGLLPAFLREKCRGRPACYCTDRTACRAAEWRLVGRNGLRASPRESHRRGQARRAKLSTLRLECPGRMKRQARYASCDLFFYLAWRRDLCLKRSEKQHYNLALQEFCHE